LVLRGVKKEKKERNSPDSVILIPVSFFLFLYATEGRVNGPVGPVVEERE